MDVIEYICTPQKGQDHMSVPVCISHDGMFLIKTLLWVNHKHKRFCASSPVHPGTDWSMITRFTMILLLLHFHKQLCELLPEYQCDLHWVGWWGSFAMDMWDEITPLIVGKASVQAISDTFETTISRYRQDPDIPLLEKYTKQFRATLFSKHHKVSYDFRTECPYYCCVASSYSECPHEQDKQMWAEVEMSVHMKRCKERQEVFVQEMMQKACHPKRLIQID